MADAAIVDGRPETGTPMDLVDPSDETVFATVGLADGRTAQMAVTSAAAAWRREWRRSTPRDRSVVLFRMADYLDASRADYAALESRNVGFPITFAEMEVEAAVDTLRFFGGAARTMGGVPSGEYVSGMSSLMRREPVGVVAAFVPWNVPLLMAVWKLAPALAGGNTIVLRPSRRTPLSALALARAIVDERLAPPGVVNVVVGDHDDVGSVLVRHPEVALVALTGSGDAGRAIARLAADGPKPLHLELGGKTPVIVCSDADLERAGDTIAGAALDNAGQDCTAATRVLVVDEVAGRLTDRIGQALAATRIGPPSDRGTALGPLIGKDRREAVLGIVDDARRDGAHEALHPSVVRDRGWYLSPGLLVDVPREAAITNLEIFGPVVTVERCADEADALARANAARYALAAGIWTRSMDRGLAMAAAVDAGKVWVNEHHRDVTEMPHGGAKDSGYGSDLSMIALEHYTRPKAVHIAIAEARP